ncbi:hypothetical protein MXMO3_01846 [Maritalea myrionectae]|uniref:Uncharacterized protein n=1 Tax=Maritalea myrionectae TaxID=454601 RepID=A0A2R4MEA2_9HYPH|nr:hypothetical protein [Maritalea myrionectae]AVX04371.1 hypothetical protein MXMO3_01846 [Maritalea myrionectae]
MLIVEVEQETDVDGKECLVFSEGLDNIKIATAINPLPNKLHSNVREIYQSERRKNELRRLASPIFLALRNRCTQSQRIGTTALGTPIIYDRTTRSDAKGRTTVEYAIAHLMTRDGVRALDLLLH